ncbi:nuclear transport factor 2 family protein [Elizabethkingia anophelis]|uniref:nuclear transport factor 2 family protein n=1 Tax=Elizabethkingia anophelis TaxID=1117645 RepID=UPI0012B37739|nr:nuclear transport factor 2 family protein [Elizabethkingia anophelis]QGN24272.1 hypothetical protein GJV56_17005 [Elizabethkingia anophelis]QNV10913.1 nuclear transport factor 2 family protein [Elizabethkingia anophelis]UTF89066.1 nuclear transport factor 2 family protein [Elizabethkingia anophelis]UTF99988.1 nuclear transport factor 2 family protein [Elizabethkingia anophelis]UTG03703.1 nuclear transport factor 2 family protein [Elizabethkingia anophelis]
MENKIKDLLAAFNKRDFETLSACIHQDAEVQLPNGTILKGLKSVLDKWKEFIEIFPDIQYQPIKISYETPDWKTSVKVTGTFTKELHLPNGKTIAPTGNKLDMQQLINFRFDDDGMMIFEKKEYNMDEFIKQITA